MVETVSLRSGHSSESLEPVAVLSLGMQVLSYAEEYEALGSRVARSLAVLHLELRCSPWSGHTRYLDTWGTCSSIPRKLGEAFQDIVAPVCARSIVLYRVVRRPYPYLQATPGLNHECN